MRIEYEAAEDVKKARKKLFNRGDVSIRPWTPTKAPDIHHRLSEHRWKLRSKSGQEVYVIEPYGLKQGDLEELLAYCQKNGWRMWVDARMAMWFPGVTTSICFEKDRTRSERG